MRIRLLLVAMALAIVFPSTAVAADLHLDAQDRTGATTLTELADGRWRIAFPGGHLTIDSATADQWGEQLNPTPVPPPAPTSRPAVTFTRVNQGAGGTGFATSVTRNEIVVAQGAWRTDIIDAANGPLSTAKVLVYKNLSRLADPDSAGNLSACVSKAQGPTWVSTQPDSDVFVNGVIAKPVQALNYANLCADNLIAVANSLANAGRPIDGFFLDDDNTHAAAVNGGLPDSNLNGVADEPADVTTWNTWMEDVNRQIAARLEQAGLIAMPNLSAAMGQYSLQTGGGWFDRNIGYFPYVYSEFTAFWPGFGAQPIGNVNEVARLMGVAASVQTVFVAGETQDTPEAQSTFTLGLCMVQAAGFCSKGSGVNNTENWYASYDRAKAYPDPTGPPVRSGNVITRPFGSKTVTVNLDTRTATIP